MSIGGKLILNILEFCYYTFKWLLIVSVTIILYVKFIMGK